MSHYLEEVRVLSDRFEYSVTLRVVRRVVLFISDMSRGESTTRDSRNMVEFTGVEVDLVGGRLGGVFGTAKVVFGNCLLRTFESFSARFCFTSGVIDRDRSRARLLPLPSLSGGIR